MNQQLVPLNFNQVDGIFLLYVKIIDNRLLFSRRRRSALTRHSVYHTSIEATFASSCLIPFQRFSRHSRIYIKSEQNIFHAEKDINLKLKYLTCIYYSNYFLNKTIEYLSLEMNEENHLKIQSDCVYSKHFQNNIRYACINFQNS